MGEICNGHELQRVGISLCGAGERYDEWPKDDHISKTERHKNMVKRFGSIAPLHSHEGIFWDSEPIRRFGVLAS
jgi:hypothetical protein